MRLEGGLKRRLSLTTLGLLVGLGIVAAMAAIAYRHLSSLDEMERWVSHTHDVLESSQAMVIAVGDMGRARRAFAVTRDEAELAPYHSALARVNASQQALRRLTADNAAQQQRLLQIDAVLATRLDQLEAAVRDARSHAFNAETEASLTNAGIVLTTRLAALTGEMDAEERSLLDARKTAMHAQSASVKRTILVGFSASVGILFLAFVFSRREVLRRRRSEEALAQRERHLAATLSSISKKGSASGSTSAARSSKPTAARSGSTALPARALRSTSDCRGSPPRPRLPIPTRQRRRPATSYAASRCCSWTTKSTRSRRSPRCSAMRDWTWRAPPAVSGR